MLASRCARSSTWLTATEHRILLRCWQSSGAAPSSKPNQPPSDVKQPEESKSFMKNLFFGKTVFDNVFPYPVNLSDEKKEMITMMLRPTEKFLKEVNNPAKNDEMEEMPMSILTQFAELGAFGAQVPEEYDGAGLNNTQMARLAEVVGANDLAMGVVMGAHQSIGYKGILLVGTDEQKRKYLPDLATGKKFAAFCLTEPGTGSDASSVQTKAELTPDGKHYILNGGKIWISNGGFAEIFTVFAQTGSKASDSSRSHVSAFIVERSHGGVTTGKSEHKMGIRGSNTVEVHFDNTKVPVENLLGAEGDGFLIAMKILNNGRFGIPAACTGAMKMCIQKTIDHVSDRVQFGKKLMEFENVQEQLMDMVLRHYATESILYMLSGMMDRNIEDYQLEAAVGKVMASENAWIVCDRAIQLHGGMGYMRECGLERVLRDLRIFRIFEGANDVLRLFIALSGLQYAGKHLKWRMQKIRSGNLGAIFETFFSSGKFEVDTHPGLKPSLTLLRKSMRRFGNTSRYLLWKHKKGIIDRQWELVKIADIAIDIYSIAAVLSRCARSSSQKTFDHELKLANLFCIQATDRIDANFKEIYTRTGAVADMRSLAKDVLNGRSLAQLHPLDY